MSTPIQAAPAAPVPYWSGATRIAFRFCFVYFGLFCLLTQVLGSLIAYPDFEVPDLSSRWPIRPIVFWTARHVFGIAQPLVYKESGSGDKTYDWVLVFCLMLMAAGGVTVWTFLDRRSETYRRLYGWFRLFMRFTLASQMIVYGMDKAVPLQMPFPYLSTLVEPFGNLSPMGVLWSSIGASPAYEIFAGCAELLGGILLFFPRTVVLGGLVCLVDMIQVFMLNMTYDVPVKLFSFHLILISLIIVAPALRSLAGFFMGRAAQLPSEPALFAGRRGNRIALAMQIGFAAWLLGINAYGSRAAWYKFGGGSPKSPLYGIWNVDQLVADGQPRAALVTDGDRLRRLIFQSPQLAVIQRMDDRSTYCGAAVNLDKRTVALTKFSDPKWKANFTFERSAKDRLTLDGAMDGHHLHIQLQLLDHRKFELINRGFHWIQEYPYNR